MAETDLIDRQAAIDAMCELMHHWFGGDPKDEIREIKRELEKLPPAQPDQSRIEKALHGLTPEEQYAFLDSLMHKKSVGWNSTALYVIAWLAGEED